MDSCNHLFSLKSSSGPKTSARKTPKSRLPVTQSAWTKPPLPSTDGVSERMNDSRVDDYNNVSFLPDYDQTTIYTPTRAISYQSLILTLAKSYPSTTHRQTRVQGKHSHPVQPKRTKQAKSELHSHLPWLLTITFLNNSQSMSLILSSEIRSSRYMSFNLKVSAMPWRVEF